MAEIGDIIAVIAVFAAVIIAILSGTLKEVLGDLLLLLIEAGLLIIVIFVAVAGQRLHIG
ncbi:MAG: hypothetical protein ACXADA_17030 [Candidatus Hodarchaeales archaeon]|jgi:hypothetical protein